MLTLYNHPRSGNCYKVRLFLALIGKAYQSEFLDVLARKNQTEEFEHISPLRQIPVLLDDGLAIWDSHAILLHLSNKYAPEWLAPLPRLGQMHAWLAVSTNEIANSLQPLRLIHVVGPSEAAHHLGVREDLLDIAGMLQRTERVLRVLDKRLVTEQWLAGGGTPTVADVACHGYVSRLEDAKVPAQDYPFIQAWLARMRELPGYIAMDAGP